MSISFNTNAKRVEEFVETPCLCSQASPEWSDFYNGLRSPVITESLINYAASQCPCCNGSGIEMAPVSYDYNLGNVNAKVLLSLFGFTETCGEADIFEFRRGMLRANNVNLSRYVRETEEIGNMVSFGLDEEGIRSRVEMFGLWLEGEIKQGATKVNWG